LNRIGRRPLICMAVIAVFWQQPAFCANTTANEAMEGCRFFLTDQDHGTLKQINAQGYCRGAVEALIIANHCAPEGVTIGQAVRVVVQYIDSQPSRLNEPFAALASEALKDTWPCRK
jgi:hypothetical protein